MNVHAFALYSTAKRSVEQTIRLRFHKESDPKFLNQLTRIDVSSDCSLRSHGANVLPSHFANFWMRQAKSTAAAEASWRH